MTAPLAFSGNEIAWLVDLIRDHIAVCPCSLSLTIMRKFMVLSDAATSEEFAAIDRMLERAYAREKPLKEALSASIRGDNSVN